jgi:hypothetical protein
MRAETPARCVAWFYKDEAGRVIGPSVVETLSTLWRVGELTASTLVKPESAARFVRICDAPALQQLLQSHAAAQTHPALTALLDCAEALETDYPLQTPTAVPPAAQPGQDWCVRVMHHHAGAATSVQRDVRTLTVRRAGKRSLRSVQRLRVQGNACERTWRRLSATVPTRSRC